jgi:hypothetical protein
VRYLGIPHTIKRINKVGVASTNDDPFARSFVRPPRCEPTGKGLKGAKAQRLSRCCSRWVRTVHTVVEWGVNSSGDELKIVRRTHAELLCISKVEFAHREVRDVTVDRKILPR